MPQKRNPDIAELIRGKSGRIMSAFTHLLIVMKGLPLAYAKDMQEDKEGTFDALDSLKLCLSALPPMIASLQLHPEEMKEAANLDYATATDLADWLTRTLKISFRQAHHIAGRCVAVAAEKGLPLNALPLNRMQEIEPRITEKVYEVLSVEQSVHTRTSYGGTAPENVRKQAQAWLKTLQPTFIP